MPRCQRGFSPSVRGQALPSELAVHVQDHSERGESRRLRAQHERSHGGAHEAVLQGAPPFLWREPAFGADREQEPGDAARGVAEPQRAFARIEHQRAPIGLGAEEREDAVPVERLVDARHVPTAALPCRFLRDPPPPLRSRLAAGPLEPDDRALRRERHDARRPELGGLLDDEVHLLALRQRLDENGIDATGFRGQRLPDLQLVPGEHGAEPPATAVEHLDLRSTLQAQDGDEMARLLRSQLHAR